jgi:hypothetical protein
MSDVLGGKRRVSVSAHRCADEYVDTLMLKSAAQTELQATLEWTFPLRFAEVISGDGSQNFRERIDLSDTGSFGRRSLSLPLQLRGKKRVRFEVWDVAANGAFTQPVWLSAN